MFIQVHLNTRYSEDSKQKYLKKKRFHCYRYVTFYGTHICTQLINIYIFEYL